MTAFLGIDGGGTKTDFLLIDASGRVLATHRAGPAYYFEVGMDGLESMLARGIRDVLTRSSLSADDVSHAFLGLPAYGESEALLPTLDHIADTVLPHDRYACGNDVVCGWAGALAGREGIAVVAGTGSIGYGEFGGRRARAGGWGELFGDEGSAYWIARETLTTFSRMSDRRMPRSPLYDLVREHFGTSADLEVCAAVYGPPALGRSEFAALARLASRAAHDGDVAALDIFERAAREIADLVYAVRTSLNPATDVRLPVSYCGGLFSGDDLLRPSFARLLGPEFDVMAPRLSPIAGAALHAATLSGRPLSAQAIATLRDSHAAKDCP